MQEIGLALVGLGLIVFLVVGLLPQSYSYETRVGETKTIKLSCGSVLVPDPYAVDFGEGHTLIPMFQSPEETLGRIKAAGHLGASVLDSPLIEKR